MRALVDADILRYEIGHSSQWTEENENTGEAMEFVRDWDFCKELFDTKIKTIMTDTEAEDVTLYLTNDGVTHPIWMRWRKTHGLEPVEQKELFRYEVAKTQPYKSSRGSPRPAHFQNITMHILSEYDWKIGNGLEADDLMAMDQTEDTIICSRDKDLRQVPGNHYSWECGFQRSVGPIQFDKKGYIEEKSKGKVFGGGEMFFMYQLLVGDTVDTIPGCRGVGPVKALKVLAPGLTRKEYYTLISEEYEKIHEDNWKVVAEEQGQLLWLKRSEDDEWRWPYE